MALTNDLTSKLRSIFGDRFSSADAVCEQHSHDESWHDSKRPDAVVYALNIDEISKVAALCTEHTVPLIPYGTGTGLEGQVIPVRGGISLDLSRMKKIVDLSVDDLMVTVEAGVTRKELNQHLHGTGLFFPVDPGADASLGGMAATRASGTNAVRYGTMRENVLALRVVLSDGRVLSTSRRVKKTSAGYDLTRLFVGNEGTLGIIAEVSLRLYPIPESITSATCSFPTIDDAVRAVIETIQVGIPVARVELLSPTAIRAVNAYSKLNLRETPTLFFEFHGDAASVQEQARHVGELTQGNGGEGFEWAEKAEDRNRLWQARHDCHYAFKNLRPGCRVISTDVCVPISKLAACMHGTLEDIEKASMPIPIVGHVGDGNFHLGIVLDVTSESEVHEARELNRRLVYRALELGGTCTGEHGVGLGKCGYLAEEHGRNAVDVMHTLKMALDPKGILNPGKIFED